MNVKFTATNIKGLMENKLNRITKKKSTWLQCDGIIVGQLWRYLTDFQNTVQSVIIIIALIIAIFLFDYNSNSEKGKVQQKKNQRPELAFGRKQPNP